MINFEALFKVTYGLYIVSAGNSKEASGFVSNTFFQVTAEPPQFAACCNKNNYTADLIKNFGYFAVSLLHIGASSDLIGKFGYKSGRDFNKFEGTSNRIGETGTPIVIEDTIAVMECKVVAAYDVGTHLIFIGELLEADIIDITKEPLTYDYYRQVKKGLSPKNAPTYIDKSKLNKITESEAKPATAQNKKYKCIICGYVYDESEGDPDNGAPPGTKFESLPSGWVCPICSADRDDFEEI
jgi:flavin reductase (DIM6/NTAB) family NADH-FMN oxidoreductase RutF/rubredoxin